MRRNLNAGTAALRLRVELLYVLLVGGMPVACATPHIPVEAAGPAVVREVPSPAAHPGAPEGAAADVEDTDAPEGAMEFTLKLQIDAPVSATSGRPHPIRASCRRSRARVGGGGYAPFAGIGCSRHEAPPWELDWKMSWVPGKYTVSVEVDGSLSGEAEFELLPSGSAYPQVLEVKVGPPEW